MTTRKNRQGSAQGGARAVVKSENGAWQPQGKSKRGRGGNNAGQYPAYAQNKRAYGDTEPDDLYHAGPSSSKRYKPTPDPAATAAIRHPAFWHPDGSVVVELEGTKFRLHQSTLARHSSHFAELFRDSDRPRGGRAFLELEHTPGGPPVPVYHVREAAADDFAALLRVIEEPLEYVDTTPPLLLVAQVLRAARALAFDAQRRWAERMLERAWPAALDALDLGAAFPHAGLALSLARASGLPAVQKRASYELLRAPGFGQRVDGDEGAGGEELPRVELLRLLHAREQLGLAWAEAAGRAPTGAECTRSGCAVGDAERVQVRWAERVHASGLFAQRMGDPLVGLSELGALPWREDGLCKKCVAAWREDWEALRQQLWDKLDGWLGLDEPAEQLQQAPA